MKRIASIALLLALGSTVLAEPEKRELLAAHETISRFEGVEYRTCRGKTGACPETCGSSGEVAAFTVLEYTRFQSHSKYGEKQTHFHIQVSDFHRKPLGDPALLSTVRSLQKGDRVRLWWNHDYVTKNSHSFPERPVVKLEKIADR